jgi:hypothetical protein
MSSGPSRPLLILIKAPEKTQSTLTTFRWRVKNHLAVRPFHPALLSPTAQILSGNIGRCNGIQIRFGKGSTALKKRLRIIRAAEVIVEKAETTVIRTHAVAPDCLASVNAK